MSTMVQNPPFDPFSGFRHNHPVTGLGQQALWAPNLGSGGAGGSQSVASIIQQLVQELLRDEKLIQQLLQALQSPGDGDVGGPGGGTGPSGGGGGGAPAGNGFGDPSTADYSDPGRPGGGGAPGGAAGGGGNPGGGSVASKPGPNQGSAQLNRNAGGVWQAPATQGVSPASTQVKSTGSGPMMTYNVTNQTSSAQSYTYSDTSGNSPMTMTLQPGQTGTFEAPASALGVRISPSSATGATNPNEVIFENGATLGQSGPDVTQNVDVSKVDGNLGYDGVPQNLTVTLGDGRTAGDGDAITPYFYPTDDAAAMGLAGDPSHTANLVFSDQA